MAKSPETEAEFKNLLAIAEKADREEGMEMADAQNAGESQDQPETTDEANDPKAETPEVEPAQEVAEIESEQAADPKLAKDKARLARNFQEFQKEKEQSRAELEAALRDAAEAKAEVQKLRTQAPIVPQKDRRGFSVADYENFAENAEKEGNYLQAKAMREEANFLAADIAKAEFLAEWHKHRQELMEHNPDMGNMQSPLAKEIDRLILEPGSIYTLKPTGIKYAVQQAKLNIESESVSAIRAENEKLKQELDRLSKQSSIPGKSGAIKRTGDKSFDDMTLAEQKAFLFARAEERDSEMLRGY